MKKLLSILLVLVLCTGLVAMTASAAEGYSFSVSSHELKEGTKEVTVTFSIKENAGNMGALNVYIDYDPEVLELVETEWFDYSKANLVWIDADDTSALYADISSRDGADGTNHVGKIATTKFKVLKDNMQGKSTNVVMNYQFSTVDYSVYEDGSAVGTVKFLCTHKYEVTGTTAGDCVTKGTETKTCTKCGDVQVKETKLGDHSTEEKTTPATCEADGKVETVCTICDKVIKTTKIAKLGHTKGEAVIENESAPTCEKVGSKDTVVYCTVCEKELSRKTETTKAIGHDWELTGTTASKCGEAGTNTYTCKNDASHIKTESVPALEHQWDEGTVTTPAGCETEGVKTYKCTREGCEGAKTEAIKATGHTMGTAVTENEVAPTCDKAGSKDTVVYCSVCNAELSRKTTTIAALGHTKGEAVTENEVAPTCEKTGSKDTVVYCSVCNAELSRKTETSKAIGHDWELTGTTASKCGEAGTNTYTCKNDATHVKTETVAALEHQWDEGTVTTAPTCTEKGVKTYTCTRGCGATKTEDVKELGHTKAEAVKENEVAPTCTVAGSYDEVVYCSVCNEKLSTKTVSVKATGHAWATEGTVKTPATCYAEGVMSYACNNGCGETKEEAIKKTAHTVTNWTHEDEVYCIGTCDVAECGAAVKERHDVKEYVQNEKGEYIGTCVVCGQNNVNKGNMIPAGDITPVLVMGGVAMLSMLAAAAYVTYRKFAR